MIGSCSKIGYRDYLGELTREMITNLLFTCNLGCDLLDETMFCAILEAKMINDTVLSWKCSGPLKFMAVVVVEDTLSKTVASQAKVESVQLLLQAHQVNARSGREGVVQAQQDSWPLRHTSFLGHDLSGWTGPQPGSTGCGAAG